MRTVIISDTHLGKKLEPGKYKLLKKLISQSDQVIINGDFWEGYLMNFDEFLNSEWKKLFPLMQKKTIYLYGNHDRKRLSDKRVYRFCREFGKSYTFKSGNWTIHCEHGNRLVPLFDEVHNLDIQNKTHRIILSSGQKLLKKIISLTPKIAEWYFKRKTLELKRKITPKKNTLYVFGHTHYPMLDLEKSFANTGYINYGRASYLIIEGNNISLKIEKY